MVFPWQQGGVVISQISLNLKLRLKTLCLTNTPPAEVSLSETLNPFLLHGCCWVADPVLDLSEKGRQQDEELLLLGSAEY